MQKKDIKAFIFDMDGLLIDSERIVKISWDMAGKDLGYEHFGDHIMNTLGMNHKRRIQYFYDACGNDFPMELFDELETKYFWEIANTEGIPLKKGARELLQAISEKGYKIGLATSSRSGYAIPILEKHQVMQYFDGAVYGNMITHSKPDPEIYLKAAQVLGVAPEYCIGVEDASNGIRSACAAGMRVILVPDLAMPSPEIQKMVYKQYESLDEIIEML